jgi:hypothetical protein
VPLAMAEHTTGSDAGQPKTPRTRRGRPGVALGQINTRENYHERERAVQELHVALGRMLCDGQIHCGELHLIFVVKNRTIQGFKIVTEQVHVADAFRTDPLAFGEEVA